MSVTFLFLSTWKAETVVEDKKKGYVTDLSCLASYQPYYIFSNNVYK